MTVESLVTPRSTVDDPWRLAPSFCDPCRARAVSGALLDGWPNRGGQGQVSTVSTDAPTPFHGPKRHGRQGGLPNPAEKWLTSKSWNEVGGNRLGVVICFLFDPRSWSLES